MFGQGGVLNNNDKNQLESQIECTKIFGESGVLQQHNIFQLIYHIRYKKDSQSKMRFEKIA
jgi:hypothetical protein